MSEEKEERSSEEPAPKIGLQSDGSVVAAEDDFCFQYLESIDWNKPIQRTVYNSPWVDTREFEDSITMKWMRYKFETGMIDPDNPLKQGNIIQDLKDNERKPKKRSKKVASIDIVTGGVQEIAAKDDESFSEDSDDFLDEYGNIREESSDSSNASVAEEETVETVGIQRRERGPRVKKKKKKKKKKNGQSPASVSGSSIQATNQLRPSSGSHEQQPQAQQKMNPAWVNFEEPRHSVLIFKEQMVYKELMTKFQKLDPANLMQNKNDYQIFQLYQDLVRDEQKEFQSYARKLYEVRDAKNFFNQIAPEVKRYVDQWYEWQLKRVYRCPRLFRPLETLPDNSMLRLLPFCNEQSSKRHFEMRIEKTVLEMGQIPRLQIPQAKLYLQKVQLKIPFSYSTLSKCYPCTDSSAVKENFAKLGVSFDENAEILAETYLPDIVISTSALKAIFNNFMPHLEESWRIPITVRQHGSKTVIYIDKPLPPVSMTTEDKTAIRIKRGSRLVLARSWDNDYNQRKKDKKNFPRNRSRLNSESSAMSRVEVPPPSTRNDEFFSDDAFDLSVLETFGTDTSNMMQVDGVDDGSSSSDNEDKLVIAIDEDEHQHQKNEEPGTRKDPEPEITPEVNTRRMTRSQTKSPAATSTSSKMPPTRGGRTRSAASKSPLPMGSQKRSSRPEGDDKESGSQKKVATRRTSARVATKSSERSESEEIQIGSKTETLDQQQERPTPPTQSRSDDKTPDGVCDTAKEEKMSVSLSSNDSPEPPDDDVIMRSPPNKKGVRRAALFDSDTDEEEKKGVPPLLSKTDMLPRPNDPNELDSGLNDLLKRSFDYINTRKAPSNESQKVESREAGTQLSNDLATTNQLPPKKMSSNLNDLLHRLKVEKQEVYLKNVEKNQLFRQQRMQAESAGGATAQSPNFLGDIMSAQNSMFIHKKPDSSDGKPVIYYQGENITWMDAGLKESSFEKPAAGKNVSYRMWNLKEKNNPSDSETLSLLVRSSTHAVYIDRRAGFNPFQTYTCSQKIEHQARMGAEVMTRKELAKEWISTLVRPGSNLIRLRTDPLNNAVLGCETQTLKQLSEAGNGVGFNPGEALGNLHCLFRNLVTSKLGKGRYLLEHNSKTGPCVRLYEEMNNADKCSKTIDLHAAYNATRPNEERPMVAPPPWLPIDVNLFTRNSIVPALFSPKPFQDFKKGGDGKKKQNLTKQQ